jgi:homoserine O-acetyltransferase
MPGTSNLDPTLHVIGAGPIGRSLLRVLGETPYRVLAVSDSSATLFDRNGLDSRALAEHKSSGGRFADREGAEDVALPILLFHGAADVVVDCTATELSRGPEAVARAVAALDADSSVVFAAKHALATEPLAFLEPRRFQRIGFNAVLGGTGLLLKDEIEDLRRAFESVAIVGNTSTTAVITAIEDGASLEAALDRAREAGFLEADPSKDLDGSDAAVKLAIVASLLTRSCVRVADIERPSFDRLDPELLVARRRNGRTTRLVGRVHASGALSLAYEELPRVCSLAVPAGRVAYSYGLKHGGARVHIGSGVGTEGTVRALLADLDARVPRAAKRCVTVEAVSVTAGARLFVPPSPLELKYGARLESWRLGFELEGPEGAPVVIVQGGISSNRHACRSDRDPSPGWWDAIVGPGRAIDTRVVRVLSTDYLGGTGASTGPGTSEDSFPAVTSHDQAEAIVQLLDALDIEAVHAFVGASYGGMVGLALAENHPRRLGRLIAFGAPERSHPAATAARSVQRRILRLGIDLGFDGEAVALARSLAMTTYRSPDELKSRFDAPPRWRDAEPVFPVETYLESRGAAHARTATPRSYMTLLRAIDLHRVRGESIRVPTLLIGATTDVLVPIQQIEELAEKLPLGRGVVRIASPYGHDAFLKETVAIGQAIREALEGATR